MANQANEVAFTPSARDELKTILVLCEKALDSLEGMAAEVNGIHDLARKLLRDLND